MEPIEYTYYEETADEDSANEAKMPQNQEGSSPSGSSSDYTSSSNSEERDDGSDQDAGEEEEEDDDDEQGASRDDQDDQDEEAAQAPSFMVPSRTIAAVEHPFMVMNVDKALDSFGPNPQYGSILDPSVPQLSVPIYLHPKDPTARPIMSHYASSHNVVFKVTVPKRTGRKRKRGGDGPWEGDIVEEPAPKEGLSSTTFRSKAKLDEARIVRRKLQDNADRYQAEVVGVIKHTHRYRGMVDFNYSMKNNEFMQNFTDTMLSRDVSKFRQFALRPGTDMTKNQEIIAPPLMTQITIPSYYHYAQNPYVRAVEAPDGTTEMVNTTAKVQSVGHFIGIRHAIPTAPTGRPAVRDPMFDNVVKAIKLCMEERPVWTRRSIINRICDLEYDPSQPHKRIPPSLSQQIVKNAIQYAGYQFKGGPWRDAVVRYGYDPRKDPKSRMYQCLIFRLRRLEVGQMGEMWQEIRKRDLAGTKGTMDENTKSHLFDGKTYCDDGKVWQVCDITDPVLAKLLADAPVRPQCDIEGSGWYHRGLWAKARAIMKCKMRAIQFGRKLTDEDFEDALRARDETPVSEAVRSIAIPTPDLKLTDAEWEMVRGKRYKGVGRQRKNKRSSYHFPSSRPPRKIRKLQKSEPVRMGANDEADAPTASTAAVATAAEDTIDGDVMQTIEDENGVGVRFAEDGSDVSDEDEDGSEYDEDEGDEDVEDFGYGYGQDQDDLADRIRFARYEGIDDAEPGEEEDDDDEEGDEDHEEEQDGQGDREDPGTFDEYDGEE